MQLIAEGKEVFVACVVGVDLGDGQDVVVDVDLVTKEFLITALKGRGEDGEFVHEFHWYAVMRGEDIEVIAIAFPDGEKATL